MPLKVIGGRFGGRALEAPPGKGTRPSSGRTRLAVMNMLGRSGVEGASVLDLYAGTGASGIEALSRGAARCVFVERDRAALASLRRNIESLGLREAEAHVLAADAAGALAAGPLDGEPFGLVFCDPPYEVFRGAAAERALRLALGALAARGGVAAGGALVLEHPANGGFHTPVPGLSEVAQRRYSAAGVSILRPP